MGSSDSSQPSIFGSQPISHIAQVGVSIEPEQNVILQAPSTVLFKKTILRLIIVKVIVSFQTNTTTYLQFGRKMLENFFNFTSSFAITQSQMLPNPNETFVPLSTLQTWYTNFERRLQQNPNFWKS